MAAKIDFQQIMSDPNFKGFSAEPVIDKSKGMETASTLSTISNVGESISGIGKPILEGLARSNIEKSLTTEINNYNEQSPTARGLKQKLEGKLPGEANPVSVESSANSLIAGQNKEIDTLSKAKQQGIITPYEFKMRIDNLTRAAVANNPAFSKEIISHSSQVLDLHGIQKTIELDAQLYKDVAAREQEAKINIREGAEKLGVSTKPYTNEDGTIDYNALNNEVQTRTGKMGDYQMMELASKTKGIVQEGEADELVKGDIHTTYALGAWSTLQAQLIETYKNNKLDQAQKEVQAFNFVKQANDKVQNLAGRYPKNDTIKKLATEFGLHATSLNTSLKGQSDGSIVATAAENSYKFIETTSKINLSKFVDPATFDFQLKLYGALGKNVSPSDPIAVDIKLWAETFLNLGKLDAVTFNNGSLDKYFKSRPDVMDPNGKTTSLAKISLSSANEILLKSDSTLPLHNANIELYNKNVKIHLDYIESNPNYKGFEKVYAMDDLVKSLAESKYKTNVAELNNDNKGNSFNLLDTYSKEVSTMWAGSSLKPNDIIIEPLANGTLSARRNPASTTKDIAGENKLVSDFNTRVLVRINNGLKAYANIQETTTQAVSTEYLQKYYGPILSGIANGTLTESSEDITKRALQIINGDKP